MTTADSPTVDTQTCVSVREISVRFALRLGLTREDAEDVAQDVLLRLVQQGEVPLNPDAWAMTVTKHLVTDRFRAKERRGEPRELEVLATGRRELDHFVRSELSSSLLAISPVAMQQITEILEGLNSWREVQVLKLLAEGASHGEIAVQLGYASADTVKSTIYKLRKKALAVAAELGELRPHPRVY